MPRQPHYPRDYELGLSYRQRELMTTLRRRREHLRERVEQYRGDPSKASFTAAELQALSWAIHIIERIADEGMLDEVES